MNIFPIQKNIFGPFLTYHFNYLLIIFFLFFLVV